MRAAYGRGKFCPDPAKPASCMNIDDVTKLMATSRDEKELRRAWEGWHTISPPIRKDYERFVELSNKGAKELGFQDTGAMWRSKYDMPPDAFTRELDRLWEQVRPLYLQLHAYTRMQLRKKYGDAVPRERSDSGASRGKHLGSGLVECVYDSSLRRTPTPAIRLTDILKKPEDRCRSTWCSIGEHFYTSLGFAPLPETFWERSLFIKPRDREVVCHASAWDIDNEDDLRIKMCIDPTAEDFSTIHHELGHNFYQRAYKNQPMHVSRQRERRLPRSDRRYGRAVGDAGVPGKIGLLDKAPDASRDIGLLLNVRWIKWRSCRSDC